MTIDEVKAVEEHLAAIDWHLESADTRIDCSLTGHLTVTHGFVGFHSGMISRNSTLHCVRGVANGQEIVPAWLALSDLLRAGLPGLNLAANALAEWVATEEHGFIRLEVEVEVVHYAA